MVLLLGQLLASVAADHVHMYIMPIVSTYSLPDRKMYFFDGVAVLIFQVLCSWAYIAAN